MTELEAELGGNKDFLLAERLIGLAMALMRRALLGIGGHFDLSREMVD